MRTYVELPNPIFRRFPTSRIALAYAQSTPWADDAGLVVEGLHT
ncbi:hypothetical protein [Amycolatopsis sp. WAC 04169]|nr:hypothetical protein [Amycolatopsis sp. WAC 04169]